MASAKHMRNLSNLGMQIIVAMSTGAGLVALASGVSQLLPPSGLPDTLGGWPLLAASAALLCGICALAMSLALRWHAWYALRLTIAGLTICALAWGICLATTTSSTGWTRTLAGWPWLALARPTVAAVSSAVIAWLLLFAALAGVLAGRPHQMTATRRALTPLWLAPLWGAGVGTVYGLLYAFVFYSPPCPPGAHCYGLDTAPWDGLRAGLTLGVGGGLIVGLTLALSLRLALRLDPNAMRLHAHQLQA